jgi:serpin B
MTSKTIRNTSFHFTAAMLIVGLLASMGTEPAANPVPESVSKGNLAFGFDLFRALAAQDPGENIFISPMSVSMALAMTLNGASGETREGMLEALRLRGLDEAEINQAFAELITALEDPDPDVVLAIANSIWARKGFTFTSDFLSINQATYDAEVESRDFGDPETLGAINGWVKENTRGKIPEILDKIDPADVMYLINAIYFNGKWTTEFDPEDTRDMTFHPAEGSKVTHPMMTRSGKFSYMKGEGLQAVRLPFGESAHLAMYIILPDESRDFGKFLEEFEADAWSELTSKMRRAPGDVTIPRFEMEYESDLNRVLKEMGMALAFDDDAKFSKMTDKPVCISKVKHKAVVEVHEEGAEAAAVTSVGVVVTSMRPSPEPFTFVADHPFLFAIHDRASNTLLFIGALTNPKD